MIWLWLLTCVVCITGIVFANKSNRDPVIIISIASLVFLVIAGFINMLIYMEDGSRVHSSSVQELFALQGSEYDAASGKYGQREAADLAKQTYVKYGYITQGMRRQIKQYAWQIVLSYESGQEKPQPPIIVDPNKISVYEYIYLTIVWIGILTQIIMLSWIKIKVGLENKVKKRLLDESENAEEFVQKIRQELESEVQLNL